MESGEKELRKAFEDVTTNNVRAAVTHGNETRKLVRELEEKIKSLDGIIRQVDEKIEGLRGQITSMQMKIYSGGT